MIKVAVFGIVASLIAMKIKTIRPEIAVVIAVISSILLAMYGLKQMEKILRQASCAMRICGKLPGRRRRKRQRQSEEGCSPNFVIGTLSSLFVAAPVAYLTMGHKMKDTEKAEA